MHSASRPAHTRFTADNTTTMSAKNAQGVQQQNPPSLPTKRILHHVPRTQKAYRPQHKPPGQLKTRRSAATKIHPACRPNAFRTTPPRATQPPAQLKTRRDAATKILPSIPAKRIPHHDPARTKLPADNTAAMSTKNAQRAQQQKSARPSDQTHSAPRPARKTPRRQHNRHVN